MSENLSENLPENAPENDGTTHSALDATRPVPVMIGGGPAVLARPDGALLVSASGDLFHHSEPDARLAQSADMLRELDRHGFDPYKYAAPAERVPALAVRVWLDHLAVQGPTIDGGAYIALNMERKLVAVIHPNKGEPLMLEVDGIPVVAQGLPSQVVPGCHGLHSLERVTDVLMSHLISQGAATSQVRIALMDVLTRGGGEEAVLATLEAHGLAPAAPTAPSPHDPLAAPVAALRALVGFRHALAHGRGRFCFGDEVAQGKVQATAADSWIVAGGGDDALAVAEILLAGNASAHVTVVAQQIETAAASTARYAELHRRHVAEGEAGGDGRLEFRLGTEPGPVTLTPTGRYTEAGVEADGYAACTGRMSVLPPAATKPAEWARARRGRVTGSLLFDENDLYLGYRLHFTAEGLLHQVDVAGAASWFLPPEAFPRALATDLAAMGRRMTPPESGSSPTDLLPVAEQAARMAAARRRGTLRETTEIPERVLPRV
ncbi:hypothetical protein [Streptomyces sp. NPDC046821]|uniref:hypothetical protein n=1 Tax=Streptomyces sp. NPDC046821 TaxID=3154702 RepID=UPI00340A97A2